MDTTFLYGLLALQWMAILSLFGLVLGAFHEIGRLNENVRLLDAPSSLPVPSTLRIGDRLPERLGFAPSPRSFVLMVKHGCSGCVDVCRKLEGVNLGNWTLTVVLCGQPPPTNYPLLISPPSQATVIHDRQNFWMRELGVKGTPTALALVGGRLVDQLAAPNVAWFEELPRRRSERGEEVMRATTMTA